MNIERWTTSCPYCGKEVEYLCVQNGGVLRSPDYTLIADWIYHATCWDKQVDDHPIPA
jgi:hypothetical protein